MTTGATGQLGLALPVQGELSGTWGDTVNNGITQYTNIAIAGTLTLTDDGAVTLSNTTGDASASNITSSLTGAGTVTAQFAIVKVAGTLTTAKVVTAPSYSKTYTVVNSATGGIVTFKASGQTGVSIAVGESALVYFNGTDYVKVAGTTSGAAAGSNTQVQFNSSGVLAGSANLTFDGTILTAAGFAGPINGTVGATTANTGAFTSLTATSGVISANSSSDALRITQIGSGNALLVEDSGNPDSTPFVINATGQVSTGFTSNPATMFGSVPQLGVHTTGNDGLANYRAGNDVNGASFIFQKTRGADPSVNTIVQAGDTLGAIYWSGADGTSYILGAQILGQVDSPTPGTNDMPGRLVFSTTADGASSPTERMRISSTGNIGIGGTATAGTNLLIAKNLTGAVTAQAIRIAGQLIQSDVTSEARGVISLLGTAASSFTLSSLQHFYAGQGTFGASSTVTTQIGFGATSSLTGATNNYGFYGDIASGSGRYNLYMNGTADNYLAGSLGIGTTPTAGNTLLISKNMTGATSAFGTQNTSTIQSDVTSAAYIYSSQPSTQAASFTLSNLIHFTASQGTIGASSTVTNQFGFFVNSPMTGATNNYGFYGNLASGTGRWNFYANGTAQNYFSGVTGFGITPPASPGVSQIFSNLDISMAGSSRGILGNLYYQAAWKFVADGYGWAIADSGGALTFSLAGLNSSGAGAAATPVERLRILANGAIGLSGANYGTSGQVLTSGGSGAAPTWTTVGGGGGSAATPTALGTVYGSMTTSGASPYLTALGYQAGRDNTGARNVFIGRDAGLSNVAGTDSIAIGYEALQDYSGADGGNIAIGSYALTSATTGTSYYNVAIGYEAMKLNTSGYNNVAMGWRALLNNTSGRYSVAIGYTALQALQSGNDGSTAVGASAGSAITTGIYNVCVGGSALSSLTTGSYNTAMGYNALGPAGTSSNGNTAFGYNAMSASGIKSNNTAIGREAGVAISTGGNNVAVGYQTLSSTTTASNHTAVGYQALYSNSTGYESTAIGYQALYSCTTGFTNVAVGMNVLRSLTTGNDNTAIGQNAGNSSYGSGAATTTGTANVFIGAQSIASAAGDSNCTVIGTSAVGKGGSTAFINGGGGGTYNGGNTTTFTTTSDRRLKKNIVDNTVGLSAINSIRVRNFEYRLPEEVDAELKPTDAIKKSGVQLGVIAQELQAVLPDCVKQETTGVFSVDSDNLTWYMINAIKELKAEFDAYKASHP